VAFETPTRDLSVEDLKARYGVSKQTLYSRKNAAQVVGKHLKGRTFFTPEEVWCLDQVAAFVERGLTLTQIEKQVREWKVEQGEPHPTQGHQEPDLQPLHSPPHNAYTVGVPPAPDSAAETTANATALAKFAEREEQAHQLARAFTTAVGQALQDTQQVVADPLRTHRLLAEAAKEEWVLSAAQLAEVCGVGRATITGWRPSTVKCGFLLSAVSDGLWEVRKATREELLSNQKARARTVPPNPNPRRKGAATTADDDG
jgi:DNA-binding transcriptional MerR regulator